MKKFVLISLLLGFSISYRVHAGDTVNNITDFLPSSETPCPPDKTQYDGRCGSCPIGYNYVAVAANSICMASLFKSTSPAFNAVVAKFENAQEVKLSDFSTLLNKHVGHCMNNLVTQNDRATNYDVSSLESSELRLSETNDPVAGKVYGGIERSDAWASYFGESFVINPHHDGNMGEWTGSGDWKCSLGFENTSQSIMTQCSADWCVQSNMTWVLDGAFTGHWENRCSARAYLNHYCWYAK